MDRYWRANTSAQPPAVPATSAAGFPADGNPAVGLTGTVPGAWWYHSVTEELRNAIAALGSTPDYRQTGQLAGGLQAALAQVQVFTQAGDGATTRTLQDKARERVTPQDFGAVTTSDPGDALTNRKAIQSAINALNAAGGGELVFTRGSYPLDVSVPLIVPSGIGVRCERGAVIVPDVSSVVDVTTRPFPLANGAVFVTGNPDTGQRAAIENGTGVTNVSFENVRIQCSYQHGTLTANQQLRGLAVYATLGVRVTGCDVENLPNTGICVQDCTDSVITGNRANGNGFGPPPTTAATKNGMSVSGLSMHQPRLANSYASVVSSNICNYNCDEGVQFGLQCGIVLTGNVCIGNGDLGIEGDTSFAVTDTAASLGFEVPSQTIIVGNYVDGRKADGTLGAGGIAFGGGNEGYCRIAHNMVRNVAGKHGISAAQNYGGFVVIERNTLDCCNPGSTQHQIAVNAQWVRVAGNAITRPGSGFPHNAIFVYGNAQTVLVEDNLSDAVPVDPVRVSTTSTAFSLLRVSGNTFLGAGADAVIFAPSVACTPALVDVTDNRLLGVNASGATDKRAVTIKPDSASLAVTIGQLRVRDNTVTYAGATQYPIGLINLRAGAVTAAEVRGNDFALPMLPWGNRSIDTPGAVASNALVELENLLPGQMVVRANAAPAVGTWAIGDRTENANPAATAVAGWVCTAAGSPGIWKSYGALV